MIQGEINGSVTHFDQYEAETMRLKENNPPKLLPLPSLSNNLGNNGFSNLNDFNDNLLPSSVPPPAPLQIPSKNLY